MTRYTYPHTIENGAGERITFMRRVDADGRERLEGENVVKPGNGPPMHAHLLQEEVLTVRTGRLAYQRPGQEPRFAGPGETVAFPPGDGHKFWNAGDDDLVCTGHVGRSTTWSISSLSCSRRPPGTGAGRIRSTRRFS